MRHLRAERGGAETSGEKVLRSSSASSDRPDRGEADDSSSGKPLAIERRSRRISEYTLCDLDLERFKTAYYRLCHLTQYISRECTVCNEKPPQEGLGRLRIDAGTNQLFQQRSTPRPPLPSPRASPAASAAGDQKAWQGGPGAESRHPGARTWNSGET